MKSDKSRKGSNQGANVLTEEQPPEPEVDTYTLFYGKSSKVPPITVNMKIEDTPVIMEIQRVVGRKWPPAQSNKDPTSYVYRRES